MFRFQVQCPNIFSRAHSSEHVKSPMGPGLEFFIREQLPHQEPAAHVFSQCHTKHVVDPVAYVLSHAHTYLGLHLLSVFLYFTDALWLKR